MIPTFSGYWGNKWDNTGKTPVPGTQQVNSYLKEQVICHGSFKF